MTNNSKPTIAYWLDGTLYLNITNQCPNNCWFCFRNYKQGIDNFNLKLAMDPEANQVISELEQTLQKQRWKEIVFCGFGEPTTRLDVLLEVARWIKKRSSVPIRLDSNGQGHSLNKNRAVTEELKAAGVSKVSVSLNGHDEETYNENCKPAFNRAFETVLEFIKEAKLAELDVEVTAVRMPEVNIQKVKEIAERLGVPFRVRDYIPCFW